MSDIKFDIEVTGVQELRQAADSFQRLGKVSSQLSAQYKPLGAQTAKIVAENTKYLRTQKQLAAAVAQGVITQKEAKRALEESMRAARERILTDKTLIDQAKKRKKAEEDARKETARLTKAYAPARVAADLYQKKVREITQAQKRNIISEKEARQSLALLTKEYAAFTKGAATGGNQFAKFNVETYKANQRIKRFASTGLQQAGYQVGDFAVQLQSGTNAAVALGQQGSQLLGIFGPAGAIAGAGLAIATAIVAPLLTARNEAKGLNIDLSEVFSTLQENQAGIQELLNVSLVGPLEEARLKAVQVLRAFEQIDLRQTALAVSKDILPILDGLEELSQLAKDASAQVGDSTLNQLTFGLFGGGRSEEARGAAAEVAKELDALVLSIAQASQGPAEDLGENLIEAFYALEQSGNATDELLLKFRELLESSGLFAARQKELLDIAEQRAIQEARAIDERFKGEAAVFDQAVSISKELIDLAEKKAERERRSIDQRFKGEAVVLNQAVSISKELLALAKERSEKERRSIDQRFKGEALLFDQAVAVSKELILREEKLAEKRRRSIDQRFKGEEVLFDQAVAISKDVQALIDQRIAKEERSIDQRFKGEAQVFDQVVAVSGDLLDLLEKRAEETAKMIKAKFEAESFLFRVRFAAEDELMQMPVEIAKGKKDKESKKTLTNIQETVDALRTQTDLETRLLGLTGKRYKEEQIFSDLVIANKQADIKLGEDKLRAIAKEIAAQQEANEMYEKAIGFVDGISDAFSDFVASGLKDFKSFVGSIKDMFVRLLADMAAAAIRNKILIPITTGFMAGAGSAAAGTVAGSFAAGTMGSTLAGYGSAIGAGITTSLGFGTTTTGATAMALNPTLAAIGTAIPYIVAIAAVIGLFTKKTKLLDSGLRATIEGFDIAIETFKKTQTSSLFGLLKSSPVTNYEAASADVADPLIKAINDMQHSIIDAAGTLGIGSRAFDNFSYQFKVSLKGLTEEEQLKKVNEEITKMGDAFASLSGHFETMNELLAVAQQRYDLETRLLSLQGNATKLLARQRELETKATHELNQGILTQIYSLEDAYRSVDIAFAAVQRSIQARKDTITRSFNEIMETFEGRINAASENVGVSQSVLGSLEGADSARIGMTREIGLEYLRSLGGASRITDQKKLDKALKAISDPSQDLYTNFVDYQRDFADQSNLIADLEKKAGQQLSTDEKTLIELQEQAESARTRYEGQIEALDEQLAKAQEQIDVMKGVDLSVKSVEESIADLSQAVLAAIAAQKEAEKVLAGGGTGGGDLAGVQSANAAGAKILDQLGQAGFATRESDGAKFKKIAISGAEQLLDVAGQLGVQTSGLSGAEIQQAISNASNLGVSMDNATRAKEFALGGYHSGGLRMVGERGPELEMTGPSRVMSNNDTRRMLQNPDLVEAVKSMKQEISELRTEQRQLGINNNKYTKRTYDLYRQWDTEGLPAERT